MTVVLFCGGRGLRLREYTRHIPKPMVHIGGEPILRHLMKYYAYYGHRHFVLCLGYQGEVVINHLLRSRDCIAAAEALPDEAVRVRLRTGELGSCTVDLVPTGPDTSVGERLRAVRRFITQDVFLANYADGLSDLNLPYFLARFAESGATAGLISVRPHSSFHLVSLGRSGFVEDVQPAAASGLRVNGGFFAMRREVFDDLASGEDLIDGLFLRLVAGRRLFGYRHEGFWACMDTTKDRRLLNDMDARGLAPWKVWLRQGLESGSAAELAEYSHESGRGLLGIKDEVHELH